jgi:serine/threonine-protein kinase
VSTPRSTEKYVLGPAIAEGGMGAVHIAKVRGVADFSRIVVVKRMHARLAEEPEYAAMFLDEARMSARIRHANVVQTLDALEVDDELWIVMEYVAGAALSRLGERGRVPPMIALAIFEDVLAGLDAAHGATAADGTSLGLVHRDISPQNVLVGVDGVARLADFGVAKAKNRENVSLVGQFKGKIEYAAPEVLRARPATIASDIWSTGVTLWETLVGTPLWGTDTGAALLFRVMETKPQLVSAAAPDVGTAFDDVVARALEADPRARFASAGEMLAALEAAARRAPAREVAAWVEETARAELATRADVVRRVETQVLGVLEHADTLPLPPSPAPPPVGAGFTVPLPVPTQARKKSEDPSRTVLIAGAGAVAIAIVSAIAFASRRSGETAPPVLAPPMTTLATTATSPSSSTPPIAIPPSEPEAASNTPAPSRPPTPRAHPPQAPTVKPTGSAVGRDCDPPYTVDAQGDKHYKAQCFR